MTFLSNQATNLPRPSSEGVVAGSGVDKPAAKPAVRRRRLGKGGAGIFKSGDLARASRTTPLTEADFRRALDSITSAREDSFLFSHRPKRTTLRLRVVDIDYPRMTLGTYDEKTGTRASFTFEMAREGRRRGLFEFIGIDGKPIAL